MRSCSLNTKTNSLSKNHEELSPKFKKFISLLLTVVMVASLCVGYFPAYAKEANNSNSDGLCVHHSSHTEDCGYAAATQGQPCTHTHDENCGYVKGVEGSCTHTHDENCGYVAASGGSSCTYAVNGCPYCVTSWEWVDDQGALSESDGSWGIGFAGASQENLLTQDALKELLPAQINATTASGDKKTLDITWDLSAIPEEGTAEGEYQISASLTDDTYALTESTSPLSVQVQAGSGEDYDLTLPSGTPPYSDHVINGVSPNGTTINLFDYWITNQTDSDNTDPADLYDKGINEGHALLFAANNSDSPGEWNKWTGKGNGPYKEIVKPELDNGYPALNNLNTNQSQLSDRNGNESLAYLFDPSVSQEGKASYKDVQGLLQVDSNGYYYYDSQKNYATYYADTNSFTLYDRSGVISGGASGTVGQFFPFNKATSDSNGELVFTPAFNYSIWYSNQINYNLSTDPSINHYFGMHMSTRFIQQNSGYTDESKKTPVTYEFSGDDDVWIFIDGKLVGDLGGIHDAASISINFVTGDIKINGVSQPQNLGQLMGMSTDTLPDDTYHTLDFFYLERGNTDSNMNLKYNLVTIPESSLIKIDQLGEPVQGAEFTLYGAKDYEENTGAKPVATGTTNGDGEFVFLKETDAGEIPITIDELYEQYKDKTDKDNNNLVLVETTTPEGYRTSGDIGLYFKETESDEILLLSGEDSIWEKGAYAMPKVTATAGNSIQLLKDANDPTGTNIEGDKVLVGNGAIENPLMFAVVFQKQGDGTWRPVSGDPLSGWTVQNASEWENVLKAAQDNPYIFQLGSSGAYQVEISNLPGNILNYYHICKNEGQAQYTIGYYYTTAETLAEATAQNTWRINSEPKESKYEINRVFSVDLYVTNIKNRLLVQKVDEKTKEPVNDANFALYKAEDVEVSDGTVTVEKDAVPYDSLATANVTGVLNPDGGGIFPTDGKVLELGEYYLIETSAPTGYKLNENATHVIVDNTGVYADAGDADDGISVLRGVGSVVKSMVQFAADDHVDTTLNAIKAALATNVDYCGEYKIDGSFNVSGKDINWDSAGSDVLHLEYFNSNKMLEYGLKGSSKQGTIDDLTLTTKTGWSKLLIRQDDGSDNSPRMELGATDITNLFSGTVTVRVENEQTGNLKIAKTVTGEDAPTDQTFTFKVKLTDNGANLSDTYETLKYDGSNPNGTRGSITFNNGEATVTLKGGERA